MGIAAVLSHEDFIAIYGETEHVKGFSYEAKMAILDNIEELQGELISPLEVGWENSFMEASELTADDIFKEGNGIDIEDSISDLIDMANDFEFDGDLNEVLANYNGSDDEAWAALKDRMLSDMQFYKMASDHIAEENNLTGLDNDNWLMMAYNG